MKAVVINKALFLFLLPVFFVFHGYVTHFNFITVKAGLLLTLFYIGVTLIVTSACWLLLRNVTKAAIAGFYLMCFFFFFGSIQDLLRDHFHGSYFSRYSFVLPLFFLVFIALMLFIRRMKTVPQKITSYLNVLLLTLLFIDCCWLVKKSLGHDSHFAISGEGLNRCDTCKKPDIFLVILDEYSGNTGLKQLFKFDNSGFEEQLEKEGFYVVRDSRSNYNYTPFSMASILNMNYLALDMEKKAPGNIDYCYREIKNSSVVAYLIANGYQFYNYSIFDFEGRPAISLDHFLPNSTTLITAQTFSSRLLKDISYNISTGKWKLNLGLKKRTYEHLYNNEHIMAATIETARQKNERPKFVYAHLMMPHYPYYFDSKNARQPIEYLLPGQETNRERYIQYLQYSNRKILELFKSIKAASDKPFVMMLLGDHGFREGIEKEERGSMFLNMNAIYLPGKNHTGFYDSMSAVNQFRVFFNTEFGQHLPILKDSTIYLWGD